MDRGASGGCGPVTPDLDLWGIAWWLVCCWGLCGLLMSGFTRKEER